MGHLWGRFRGQPTRIQWFSALIAVVLIVGVIGLVASSPKKNTVATTPAFPTTTAAPTTKAPTRTVAPTTTLPTTTTTPPTTSSLPEATLTVTATGTTVANYVSILINGQESQHTAVTLPTTYQVGVPGREGVVASAQNSSGQSKASITCRINVHNGLPPVTKTAVGPYAIAQCNTNTKK